MHIKKILAILSIALSTLLSGCAMTGGETKPSASANKASRPAIANGPVVVIRSVKDARVFGQTIGDPGTPSLGVEGATKASPERKARVVGRKQGDMGKESGEVTLEAKQTVESAVRERLASAFEQAGYSVQNLATDDPSVLVVDVHIKKFWVWMKPGFWSPTLHAEIETELQLSGGVAPVSVSVHAKERNRNTTDGVWMEIVNTALGDYRAAASANIPKPIRSR